MTEPSMRYRSAPERRRLVLEIIAGQGFCTFAELSQALKVSDMTVRRDVDQLLAEGKVQRVRGGVTVLGPEVLNPSDFTARAVEMGPAKVAIAHVALRFVSPGSSLCIDSGTTTLELARRLPEDAGLTVATHSVAAINALMNRRGMQVHVMGGVLHPETQDFAGPSTVEALKHLRFDTLFLAAGGVTGRGVYCASDHEALVKRALIEAAHRVVLLADSRKFSSSAMVRVCGLEALSHAVIDDGITPEDAELLRAAGVPLTVAPAPESAASVEAM
jgi:DeoR family transcriptional regulator, aga operon transcriptional repressor